MLIFFSDLVKADALVRYSLNLHNLVCRAAEIVGTEAGKEVCRWRGQEEMDLFLEPVVDEPFILQLCLAERGNSHLPQSLQSI